VGLDLSAAALIGCGTGLIFCLFGAFFVAHAKGNRLNLALGIVYISNGLAGMVLFPGGILLPEEEFTFAVPVYAIALAFDLVSLAGMVALAVQQARRLPSPSRRIVAWFAAGLGLALAAALAILALLGFPSEYTGTRLVLSYVDGVTFRAFLSACAIVALVGLESIRRGLEWSRTGAALLLAVFPMMRNASSDLSVAVIEFARQTDDLATYAFLLASLLVLGPVAWSLGAMAAPNGKHARNFLLLVAANMILTAFLHAAVGPTQSVLRVAGIVAVASMAAPAYAVVRLDLLQTRLPRPTIRAGTLASIGLGALFITAQVAQNFLSDELGLLTGGIVAGAAVFAAYPLQKAAERAMEGRGRGDPAKAESADKYRRLVETAWRDGRLGANERLLLAEARRQLGLDAETASSIDEGVARKHAARPQPRRGRSVGGAK
jgi:hypothetical protein